MLQAFFHWLAAHPVFLATCAGVICCNFLFPRSRGAGGDSGGGLFDGDCGDSGCD